MTGSTPPRKSRSIVAGGGGGGEGGLEDAWRTDEAAKKTIARVWGVSVSISISLRSHVNSFLLLLLVLFVVLAVSVTTKNNSDAGAGETQHAPPLPPPEDDAAATTAKQQQRQATPLPPPADTNTTIKLPHQAPSVDAGSDRGECDLFSGRWVYDEAAYPLYKESTCRFMSEQSACEKYGRTDLRYQHWRWQPHGCDLPRSTTRRWTSTGRRCWWNSTPTTRCATASPTGSSAPPPSTITPPTGPTPTSSSSTPTSGGSAPP